LVLILGLFFLYQHLKARAVTEQQTSALTAEERERLRAILKE